MRWWSPERRSRACPELALTVSGSLACRWTAAEADDVAVGILNVEVFSTPRGGSERPEDRDTVCDALLVKLFDTVDAPRGVEMLIVTAVAALRLGLGRFLQV